MYYCISKKLFVEIIKTIFHQNVKEKEEGSKKGRKLRRRNKLLVREVETTADATQKTDAQTRSC